MRNDKDQRSGLSLWHLLAGFGWGIIACALISMCAGCKTRERVVTVPEIHTEHHWHTDSVFQRDSIHHETVTTIMQLDSAAMAEYGIRLQAAGQAWLIRTSELEQRMAEKKEATANRDTVHDSISVPVPYPVEKEVVKPLTWWQRTRIHAGEVMLIFIVAAAGYGLVRLRKFL